MEDILVLIHISNDNLQDTWYKIQCLIRDKDNKNQFGTMATKVKGKLKFFKNFFLAEIGVFHPVFVFVAGKSWKSCHYWNVNIYSYYAKQKLSQDPVMLRKLKIFLQGSL